MQPLIQFQKQTSLQPQEALSRFVHRSPTPQAAGLAAQLSQSSGTASVTTSPNMAKRRRSTVKTEEEEKKKPSPKVAKRAKAQ
jgi:hypothetical protein